MMFSSEDDAPEIARGLETTLVSAGRGVLGKSCASRARPARNLQRRDAGGAVEGADEIGEIAEADVIGDIGDRRCRRRPARRAAWRSRERTRYWCGVTPSTPENSRRKWNGLMPAWPAASSRSIGRCECASIHSAVSTARRRSRAAAGDRPCAARRKPPRQSGWRTAGRSRRGRYRCGHRPPPAPVRRAPSIPAAAARSRSARPRCGRRSPPPVPGPGKTTGTRRRRRGRGCRVYSSPGWPTSTDPATSSNATGRGSWQPKLPLRT